MVSRLLKETQFIEFALLFDALLSDRVLRTSLASWPCSDVLLGQLPATSFTLYVLPCDASSSFWTWAALCAAGTQSWRQRTLEVQRTQTASTRPSRCLWPSRRTPRSQRERGGCDGMFIQMPFCLSFFMLLPGLSPAEYLLRWAGGSVLWLTHILSPESDCFALS